MRNDVSEPLDRACVGRILPERNMRSHLVIIDGIFRKDSAKVIRVERDQMISALAQDRPDQAFSISVLPGRAERGGPVPDAHCSHPSLPVGFGDDPKGILAESFARLGRIDRMADLLSVDMRLVVQNDIQQ
jgi:hypothetical protein